MDRVKLLIIYHSGVGNTKQVAEWMRKHLEENNEVEIYSVENLPKLLEYEKYDGVIMGFPTIHTHPTKRIMNFLERTERLKCSIPTFVYTTCGLCSANTLRIFCKRCKEKNFIPIRSASYRCKAIDGILLVPQVRFFSTYERNIRNRIANECDLFVSDLAKKSVIMRIPRFKLYSIMNYPNKLMGQLLTLPIYIHKHRCVKCTQCIIDCPAQAMEMDRVGYPMFNKTKCEKCYRCIHHCPKHALSLSKRKIPNSLWTADE